MIHPTAVIHPKAQLDSTVSVGPYAVIDQDVAVGPHCVIGPQVHLTGHTLIGAHNQFHTGCVIGGAPQDLKYRGEPTCLRIGEHNVFREHCTVNRSNKLEEPTVIGSHAFLMQHSHVAHNCLLDDHVILAGGALGALTEKYPAWNQTFWEHLDVAIQLHQVHKVIVLDHRDCGAYQVILGEDFAKDRAKETTVHAEQLQNLRKRIVAQYPSLQVELLLMSLDGKVEKVS